MTIESNALKSNPQILSYGLSKMERNYAASDWWRHTLHKPAKVATIFGPAREMLTRKKRL